MSKSTNISKTNVEQILTEAGFTFTVVDRCPDATCRVCGPLSDSRAA